MALWLDGSGPCPEVTEFTACCDQWNFLVLVVSQLLPCASRRFSMSRLVARGVVVTVVIVRAAAAAYPVATALHSCAYSKT